MVDAVDLKVNRDLINPQFEGYKLSLDALPVYSATINNGLATKTLADDQFSYHHAKIFGVHNHLVLDPWKQSSVYYIDNEWNIVRVTAKDNTIETELEVLKIPDSVNQKLVPGRYNAHVQFVSTEIAVVADGAGQLHLVDTGNRSTPSEKWKILLSKTVPEETKPCLLMDAVELSDNENHRVECLLVYVEETGPEEKDKYRSLHLTYLEWVTFLSVDRKSWTLERTRRLVSSKPFSYAALDHEGPHVIIAGEAMFEFVLDTLVPVEKEEEKKDTNDNAAPPPPEYTWSQTIEDITVQFTVPPGVSKADIYMTLTPDHLDIGVKNSDPLLKGSLHDSVEVESSTWTIDGQKVELILNKVAEGTWPIVVTDDNRGEHVTDPALAAEIHGRLAHLTSEGLTPEDPKASGDQVYNTQQLEECDAFPDDSFILFRLDGETHKCTHKANLASHQWLFSDRIDPSKPPALCFRHDVDGLLWQPACVPKEGELPWQHMSTFNALGYVQASKEQRKFSACPPDCSYAVICDCTRHVYIYRKLSAVSTPVRNRKTGEQVSAVAKQQVVSFDSVDQIEGLQVTNEKLFVVTEKKLYVVQVNTESV